MDKEQQQKLQRKRTKELAAAFGEMVRKEGFGATVQRAFKYARRRWGGKKGRFLPKADVLVAQRTQDVTGWPKISVCVPVFNAPQNFFEELLASVVGQTYPNWQLCIADASDAGKDVKTLVEKQNDGRIAYARCENKGISENTNVAAALADGDYIALLDHDDVLSPNALFEVAKVAHKTGAAFLYSDEALFTTDIKRPSVGHFKPDFSLQYLLNVNYIAHLAAVRQDIFEQVGGLRAGFDGSQDHDLFLRVAEVAGGAVHIPKVLYYWRQHAASTSTGTAAKPYVREAALKAIDEHLARTDTKGKAADGKFASTYKVDYEIMGQPLVSIVVPSHEHVADLRKTLESIFEKTTYGNFEVVVVENNSKQAETFAYYDEVQKKHANCRVVDCPMPDGFNFSRLCNFGRAQAKGEFVLFLNNDMEVIDGEWLGELLQLCQLSGVGIVGGLLYYPDDTVQHAGVITGLGGYAGHSHKYARRGGSGYMFRLASVQELSAVTGACLMIKAGVFDEVKGFDEGFTVAYNDVDLCLRVRRAGYSVLYTPYAELYHYESKSRGSDEKGEAKERFETEKKRLRERYGDALLNDPFYNPNLTKDREDFSESDVLPKA